MHTAPNAKQSVRADKDHMSQVFRPRYPVDHDYAALLGYAVFLYAMLEWQVVYIGEKLQPGFVSENIGKEGGRIAAALTRAINANSSTLSTAIVEKLDEISARFQVLKDRRNALIHARPITMPGPERTPGLSYNGRSGDALWTEDEIIEAIKEFEKAAEDANNIYYRDLQ